MTDASVAQSTHIQFVCQRWAAALQLQRVEHDRGERPAAPMPLFAIVAGLLLIICFAQCGAASKWRGQLACALLVCQSCTARSFSEPSTCKTDHVCRITVSTLKGMGTAGWLQQLPAESAHLAHHVCRLAHMSCGVIARCCWAPRVPVPQRCRLHDLVKRHNQSKGFTPRYSTTGPVFRLSTRDEDKHLR